MAKFLTTRSTTAEIEKIFNNAQRSLVIISPFVRIPDNLFQNLIAADRRNVKITLIYGKKDLKADVRRQLSLLTNLEAYFLKNVHAKCYFNEQSMVITSLNLYDFSEQSNREMGVLITRQDDNEVFNEAVREAQMIKSLSSLIELRQNTYRQQYQQESDKEKPQSLTQKNKESLGSTILRGFSDILFNAVGLEQGHCLGCGKRIDYDEYRPFCIDCYRQRRKATYCHSCGQVATVSLNKPVCRSCWEKTKQYR